MKFIAEVGVNHNGSLKTAKKMIDKAVIIGADIIKFQSYNVDLLLDKKTKKAKYQVSNLRNKKLSQYEMLKKYQISYKNQIKLIEYCKRKKIEFLTSVFDNDSLEFVKKQKLTKIKIPSGEINNFLLLRDLKNFKGELLISTGMAKTQEIEATLNFLKSLGIQRKQITLFYCVTDYPTKFCDLNLNTLTFYKKKFKINVGFSDHTLGIEAPIAATTYNIKYIEKHITLDKNKVGPDHKASLNFKEFKQMINSCKNILYTLKNNQKKTSSQEKKNSKYIRKFLFAKQNIKKGEKFTYQNLTAKRFGKGISVGEVLKIINKKSKKNFRKNQVIKI
jgi:N,N'-diacetyllegionaminate synthase